MFHDCENCILKSIQNRYLFNLVGIRYKLNEICEYSKQVYVSFNRNKIQIK